jgi:hypothetical protein
MWSLKMHKEIKGMHCKRCDDCDPYRGDDRVEEDWETTGQDEMNQLAQRDEKIIRPIDVADRLENLESLIRICATALLAKEIPCQNDIAFILHHQVINELKTAQKEIWNL